MKRGERNRARLTGWHLLENRSLLTTLSNATNLLGTTIGAASAPVVPGNTGHIVDSQFESNLLAEVAAQEWKAFIGGGIHLNVVPNSLLVPPPPPFHRDTINGGNILHSQFNSFGFNDVGAQVKYLRLHGGLNVSVSDETLDPTPPPTGILGAPVNTGDITNSQFNDSGFGNVGLQLQKVGIGGGLTISSHQFVRPNIGAPGAQAAAQAGSAVTTTAADGSTSTGERPDASGNRGLIHHSQVNNGGFGDVGMQWRKVHVGGSVGIGFERWEVGPRHGDETTATQAPGLSSQSATNIGQILTSQVSEGAFGDVGMQLWNVNVDKNVATSYNTLSIQPEVDNVGPITANGLTLGLAQLQPDGPTVPAGPTPAAQVASSAPATAATASRPATHVAAAAVPRGVRAAATNSSTNSGRIARSQVAEGGFGDFGLQWRNVKVHGSVTAVHNSLSVQPENTNQGLINVNNIHYPSQTVPLPPSPTGPLREVPPAPPVIAEDGDPVTTPLPKPTKPFDRSFDVNQATNSGNITSSQFADGGFGDIGMQWLNVGVSNNVQMVHNSLSVQPEGNNLTGVNVSNVSFGDPLPPGAADRLAALHTDLTPSPFIPIRQTSAHQTHAAAAAATASSVQGNQGPDHVNDRLLDHVQLIDQPNAPIILQWENLERNHGLQIVNNSILLNIGPNTGPITLNDIRFPGMAPINTVITPAQIAAAQQAGEVGLGTSVTDQATNSGILLHNQFSGGGFGDIGMQWRNVHVTGPVAAVHNTLSVDVSGEKTGPINIANVVYNSGTIANPNQPFVHTVVSPPPFYSRLPFVRQDRSFPLPHDPNVSDQATNSGILKGGQFSARGLGHIMLQWRGITIHGPVTVMDNVLSIDTHNHGSGPITISHVTYA